MTYTLYGIKRCDAVTKARRWLDTHKINYRFHDFRTDGLDRTLVSSWVERVGYDALINRRGMTWRRLPMALRDELEEARAIDLMLDNPTLIKRPILSDGDILLVGFDEPAYAKLPKG